MIGVNPDYKIIVRNDVLNEIDGSMLKYEIQERHIQKILLPSRKTDWSDRQNLELRFKKYQEVG